MEAIPPKADSPAGGRRGRNGPTSDMGGDLHLIAERANPLEFLDRSSGAELLNYARSETVFHPSFAGEPTAGVS